MISDLGCRISNCCRNLKFRYYPVQRTLLHLKNPKSGIVMTAITKHISLKKSMLRSLRIIALVFLAWFFLHCSWVVKDGMHDFTGKADVAIVLGNTVFEDGSLSPWLQGRVDEALKLNTGLFTDRNCVSSVVPQEGGNVGHHK